jgi:hypothetical protein
MGFVKRIKWFLDLNEVMGNVKDNTGYRTYYPDKIYDKLLRIKICFIRLFGSFRNVPRTNRICF